MEANDYALIFQGQVVDGFELAAVKEYFTALMACEPEKTEMLFSGRRLIFKRFASEDEAQQAAERLRQIGMMVEIAPVPKKEGEYPDQTQSDGQESPPSEAGPLPSASPSSTSAPPASTPTTGADETETEAQAVAASLEALQAAPAKAEETSAVATSAAGSGQQERRILPFVFSGKGSEFFRIWIVNVLLTILTLGIYSAWAKVRTLRYFYGNTSLDGSAFEYLAEPMKILKGRLIVFAFFMFFSTMTKFYPLTGMLYLPVLLILTPWVIRQSLRFRYHYTAWRGVRFSFGGGLWDAAKAFIFWSMLPFIGVGLAVGLAQVVVLVKGSWWGDHATAMAILLGLIFFMSFLTVPLPWHRQTHYLVDNSRFGAASFNNSSTVGNFYKLFFVMIGIMLLIALIVGVCGAVIGFFLKNMEILEKVFAADMGRSREVLITVCFGLPYFVVVMIISALYKVRMTNLRVGKSTLGPHQLVSTYVTGSYLALVVTNTLFVILTLGLFYPFAKVRTARYAAAHTAITIRGDLDGFVTERQNEVSALGSEAGDFLDIDIGF